MTNNKIIQLMTMPTTDPGTSDLFGLTDEGHVYVCRNFQYSESEKRFFWRMFIPADRTKEWRDKK
jgi:hypothetical protein